MSPKHFGMQLSLSVPPEPPGEKNECKIEKCKEDVKCHCSETDKHNEIEAKFIPGANFRPVASDFGHCAANPGNDGNFERELDRNIAELLLN